MNVTFKPWSRRLAWALPMFALLAGCDGGKDTGKQVAQEPTKPHAVATYVSAPWEALPSVSDSDLLAGFESWRSACQRLKADPIWGATCAPRPAYRAMPWRFVVFSRNIWMSSACARQTTRQTA